MNTMGILSNPQECWRAKTYDATLQVFAVEFESNSYEDASRKRRENSAST